jgi:hypothetical protein
MVGDKKKLVVGLAIFSTGDNEDGDDPQPYLSIPDIQKNFFH